MSKFKKGTKKEVEQVSTASLPDIVFMLLFFFMIVTVLRSDEVEVKITPPQASEVTKIEKKHLIRYIHIGPPNDKRFGSEPVIQLDDSFKYVSEVRPWIEAKREEIEEAEKPAMVVSLKVDKDTRMGIVTAVKQELREAQALKIMYSSTQRSRTGSDN